MAKYYLVAVNTPFNKSLLTYSSEHESDFHRGDIVEVPIGKRKETGVVLSEQVTYSEPEKLKSIIGKIEIPLKISEAELSLFEWMAKYYHYPLGQLINDTIPHLLKRPHKTKELIGKKAEELLIPNNEQAEIIKELSQLLFVGFSKNLVHGITGSGKTTIYLHLMQQIFDQNKSVLFLLPEINLTPQFLETFQKYLSVPIYAYHSSVSNSDKYNLWVMLQHDTRPKLIIGVRSAIFLPEKNLGLIIVDEEHDQSFKQDDRCTYHGRDVAIKKASMLNIPLILGSATPSVETYDQFVNKKNGKYFSLFKRANNSMLPKIKLVDTRKSSKDDELIWPLNSNAMDSIQKALDKNEQVLVFVNRLGYATYLQCRNCGHQFACPNCSTNLKVFKKRNELDCQYCEYKEPMPEICPECSNLTMLQKGFGTERVHSILEAHFKNNKVARFDRDEIKTTSAMVERLEEFHSHQVDILVGTQMLAKGHNFERVNLVIILGIDAQLNFPDFRANEKAFQLLTQVAGRSGRFGQESEVQVLTLNPENSIFKYVENNQLKEFYQDEIRIRELCQCPPFTKLAMIYLSSSNQLELSKSTEQMFAMARQLIQSHFPSVDLLGPRPAMIERKVNKFTWLIMLRSADVNQLHNLMNSIDQNLTTHHSVSVKFDIDPQHID